MWQGYEPIVEQARLAGMRALSGVAILLAFWIASKILAGIIKRVSYRAGASRDLFELLAQTAKTALLILGAITALGTAGVDVSALVAGLGLTGFALGFAFRDILSNVLAGVLLLLYRPYSRGDHIAVSGLEGKVQSIDLRYTILRHEDKTILIPNSHLFTNPIIVSKPPPHPAAGESVTPGTSV